LPAGARALFSCIPTNKAVVAATVGAAEAAQAVGEHLALLLRGYAPIHRAARRQGVPTIGVSHGTVFGCVSEHGVPMAGFDHEFTTGRCSVPRPRPSCSGTSTGIRHGSRKAGQGGSASPIPARSVVFTTARKGKGFLFWEIDADQARFTLEPTPACRTSISCSRANPTSTPCARLSRSRTSLARSCACAGPSPMKTATRSRPRGDRALLEGAAETKLEGRIVPVVRTRAAGISQLANLADKVRVWAQVTEARAEPLLACLQALASQEPEAIAECVCCGAGSPCGESRTADQANGRS
jgi:exonuclease SbcD